MKKNIGLILQTCDEDEKSLLEYIKQVLPNTKLVYKMVKPPHIRIEMRDAGPLTKHRVKEEQVPVEE